MRKILAALAPVVLGGALALTTGVLPASAATPHTYTVPVKGSLSLDALGWAGTGSPATCTTGAAVVNAQVGFYTAGAVYPPGAGCAADFAEVNVTAAATVSAFATFLAAHPGSLGPFLLQYAPNGITTASACVSTVTDVQGAFARLRTCAGTGTLGGVGSVANMWQTFALVPNGDGFYQIEAFTETTPYFLNDKGFGGKGSPAISWVSTTGENQLFDRG